MAKKKNDEINIRSSAAEYLAYIAATDDDPQSLYGKAVLGIARRAKPTNVPVIAVVGIMDENMSEIFDEGVTEVYETGRGRDNFAEIKANCMEDLRLALESV